MENATHIIQVAFEGALFLTGIFYVLFWMGGHKLKNRQALGLFAIGFAVLLVLDLVRSFLPSYILLIVCSTPLLVRPLRALLSKPASRVKLLFARKPSELPEKSESVENPSS